MGTPPSRAAPSGVDAPPDALLEAAYDLMAAGKRLEIRAMDQPGESRCLAATLGILGSTLASVSQALEHVADRGPGIPSDREIDGVLRVVRRTLNDAAQGCARARELASRPELPPDSTHTS